ncbi:nonsense-mediated mRNA decay factor SMG9-like isoform X2 [Watersipora subatra]
MRVTGRLWKPTEGDGRGVNVPKHAIPNLLQSGELPAPPPTYKIRQRNDMKPGLAGSDWTKSVPQHSAVKIVDGSMNWCGESLFEFLTDNNEYRVIGVLGTEGVGKTHAMNLLATHPKKEPFPFAPELNEYGCEGVGHTTQGINAFITSERVILLDCQPIFSTSVLHSVINNERNSKFTSDYSNREDMCDSANLELVMFILSVCHIVLVVENWFTDPNLHRILQSVEMLKPPQLSNDKPDDHNEFKSKIVFINNSCAIDRLDESEMKLMETCLTQIYSKSSLCIYRRGPGGDVKVTPLAKESSSTSPCPNSSISEGLNRKFVEETMAMPISPVLSHTTLSERNWFQYAAKMWEAVRKSPFISEYMRLLI